MPVLPLQLRPSNAPQPAVAGWLPGADLEDWLAEAGRLAAAYPAADIRLYLLAVSATDQSAAGVILTVSGTPPDLSRVFSARVQLLAEPLPGLLIPVDARLSATLTAAEQQRIFPWPLQFLHPVLGLTGFEERDALSPWQLLVPMPEEPETWLRAVPGPPPPPALRQLSLVQELSLEELMAGGSDGIGSGSPDINLPGGAGLLGKAGGFAVGVIGAFGAGMLSGLGGAKAAEKMTQWSQRQMRDLQDRRCRELNKLLDQFDKNPMEALRHAIPLTGAEARRGNASAPGWKLGSRTPDLHAARSGGGAVDVWSIPSDTRMKLERKYRDSAAREAAAGNFGRAAYIYGELLGDWARAAEMLEKAGRPREAARIYTERLRSGARAAQCLENAGLLAEAAALYRDVGQHEKAGDLLARLGRVDAAREYWETALRLDSNPVQKARILEQKLDDSDRALVILEAAWASQNSADRAPMDAHFALLGRLGRHAAAGALLDRLEQTPSLRLPRAGMVTEVLHTVFCRYPDFTIQAQAAALALIHSGEALAKNGSRAETAALLALLPKFSPEDRLLARDAGRFSLTKHRPAVPLMNHSRSGNLRPERVLALNGKVTWESLTDSPAGPDVMGWYWGNAAVAGKYEKLATLVQGCALQKAAEFKQTFWTGEGEGGGKFRHLIPASCKPLVVVHNPRNLTASWGNGAMKPEVLALGPGRNGEFVLLVLTETGSLTVEFYGREGSLHATRVLDYAPPGMTDGTWFTAACGNELWIAGMHAACCVTEKGEFQPVHLNATVTGFSVAPPVLPSQAIAVTEQGEVVLLFPKGPEKPMKCVNLFAGTRTVPPVCVFTNDGRAVIADAGGGVEYQMRGGPRKLADIILPGGSGTPIAASAIGATGFAILTDNAKVLGFGF